MSGLTLVYSWMAITALFALAHGYVLWSERAERHAQPKASDYLHVTPRGAVWFDYGGWWRTEQGRNELRAQCAAMNRFEAHCRARSSDGSFSFYD